jgi:hypothetical protein
VPLKLRFSVTELPAAAEAEDSARAEDWAWHRAGHTTSNTAGTMLPTMLPTMQRARTTAKCRTKDFKVLVLTVNVSASLVRLDQCSKT